MTARLVVARQYSGVAVNQSRPARLGITRVISITTISEVHFSDRVPVVALSLVPP